ncbi:class I SAM-dependent methyltransferase [Paenibacillus campi]|uniref:class I SAM-dependent methyltransferase n=1 Tax=Paenibacillus campi TaxID=3106031 RepID=UPI002AFE9E7E|nr:class I SAM-dependent methyltransferase [Paenibacillus sp. SGZ-1014]
MNTYAAILFIIILIVAIPALILLVYYSWRNGISPLPASASIRSEVSKQVQTVTAQLANVRRQEQERMRFARDAGRAGTGMTLQQPSNSETAIRSRKPHKEQGIADARHQHEQDVTATLLATLCAQQQAIHVVEAGSGWGTLALRIAAECPTVQVIGIENSPLPLLCSRLFAWLKRADIHFQQGDLYRYHYEQADVIVCYLFPRAMRKLSSLLEHQCRPNTYVISVYFALPDWEPERVIICQDWYRTPVYVYRCRHRSYLV